MADCWIPLLIAALPAVGFICFIALLVADGIRERRRPCGQPKPLSPPSSETPMQPPPV